MVLILMTKCLAHAQKKRQTPRAKVDPELDFLSVLHIGYDIDGHGVGVGLWDGHSGFSLLSLWFPADDYDSDRCGIGHAIPSDFPNVYICDPG